MRVYLFFVLFALTLLGSGFVITDAVAAKEPAWQERCNDKVKRANGKPYCEMVSTLVVQETGQRFLEFAIGYPEGSPSARGVVTLPLGVMLTEGVSLKVDDGPLMRFQVRYCNAGGCYAFLNLGDEVLGQFKKGNQAVFSLVASDQKRLSVAVPLSGFSKRLSSIKP